MGDFISSINENSVGDDAIRLEERNTPVNNAQFNEINKKQQNNFFSENIALVFFLKKLIKFSFFGIIRIYPGKNKSARKKITKKHFIGPKDLGFFTNASTRIEKDKNNIVK